MRVETPHLPGKPRRPHPRARARGGTAHVPRQPVASEISAGLPSPKQQKRLSRVTLTPAQRRLALRAVNAYEAGPRPGNLQRALGRVGEAYLHNPVARNPIIGRPGLLGGVEDLVRSVDPIALEQKLHQRAQHPLRIDKGMNAGIVVGGGGGFRGVSVPAETMRALTREEAVARHAELDKQISDVHAQVGKLTGHPYSDVRVARDEQLRRNKINGLLRKGERALAEGKRPPKGFAYAKRHGPQRPVAEELAHHVNEHLEREMAKTPDEPWVKAYRAAEAERERLRAALEPPLPGEEHPAGHYGTVPVRREAPIPARAVADVPNIPGMERSPEDVRGIVAGSLGTARRAYGQQKRLRREELGRRVARGQEAVEAAEGGFAKVRAAKGQLRGELPKVTFQKLRQGTITQADLEGLVRHLQEHPALNWFEKNITGPDALEAAFRHGQLPTPSEVDILRRAFGDEAADVMAHKSFARKVSENALGLWNLPRALSASIDVSFPGRQGIGVLAANPKIWMKAWRPQMKALRGKAGERYYHETLARYHDDPYFGLSQEAGVKYTELGKGAMYREEPFVSKYSEKIPGVRASARAYTLYGDTVRLNLFKHYVHKAEREGVNVESLKELHSIAKLVNTLSGRGGGKRLQQAAPVANAFFFAPQLIASRVNMLNPAWGRFLTPFARRQLNIARLRLGLGAGAVLTGAALAGAKVESDPRNADFAKIRVGNTRFDILAGMQQYPRAISQIGSGKIISSTTGRTLELGPGFGQLSRWDIGERFGSSKLNPSASLIYDLARGRDFAGDKFSWPRAIKQRTIPLSIQDALDLYHKHDATGAAEALGGYGISATGVGVQSYGNKAKARLEAKVKDAVSHQNLHLANLIRKGLLPKHQRAEYREALDIYNARNLSNATIEAETKDKPLEREHKKMAALLDLLAQHKLYPPHELKKYRHHYATARLTPRELQRDREWFWRDSGVGPMIAWYRDKAGASD